MGFDERVWRRTQMGNQGDLSQEVTVTPISVGDRRGTPRSGGEREVAGVRPWAVWGAP